MKRDGEQEERGRGTMGLCTEQRHEAVTAAAASSLGTDGFTATVRAQTADNKI